MCFSALALLATTSNRREAWRWRAVRRQALHAQYLHGVMCARLGIDRTPRRCASRGATLHGRRLAAAEQTRGMCIRADAGCVALPAAPAGQSTGARPTDTTIKSSSPPRTGRAPGHTVPPFYRTRASRACQSRRSGLLEPRRPRAWGCGPQCGVFMDSSARVHSLTRSIGSVVSARLRTNRA